MNQQIQEVQQTPSRITPKESPTETHYNQSVKSQSQSQRKNIESSNREMTHPV